MTDSRPSTALHHFDLEEPPPPRWTWAVVVPDPSGRLQLPPTAVELLGHGSVQARIVGGVLVLRHAAEGPGHRIGIDRRGRFYLPVWLRRSGVVVATDPVEAVVVVVDVAVLDPVGEQLRRAVRT